MASLLSLRRSRRAAPAPLANDPKSMFQARLQRVNTNTASRNVLWVGTDEAYAMPGGELRRVPLTRMQRLIYWVGRQIGRALSLVAGFAGYGVASVVIYRMGGFVAPFTTPDMKMAVSFLAAFLIGVILARVLGVRFGKFLIWKAIGALAGVTLFHDVVFLYPHYFAMAAPHWTHFLLSSATPKTLHWRGAYIPLPHIAF